MIKKRWPLHLAGGAFCCGLLIPGYAVSKIKADLIEIDVSKVEHPRDLLAAGVSICLLLLVISYIGSLIDHDTGPVNEQVQDNRFRDGWTSSGSSRVKISTVMNRHRWKVGVFCIIDALPSLCLFFVLVYYIFNRT